MAKYDRLGIYLREQGRDRIPMTFAEIERVVGTTLPKSQQHQAWWSNSTSNNVMTKVWLDAGYRTEQVDVERKRLVFRRVGQPTPQAVASGPYEKSSRMGGGMSDAARNFEREDEMTTECRHPAYGWMKGTFTIAPGTDLTAPVYTDEEWAEIEKEMEADWDEIERGMGAQK